MAWEERTPYEVIKFQFWNHTKADKQSNNIIFDHI